MFEIKATTNEVSDGSLAISWCLDTETLKYLSDTNTTDPQVVLVVAPEGHKYDTAKEYRTVVPMKDLVAYVNFRVSGPNKIFGMISTHSAKEAKTKYLSKECNGYSVTLVDSDGSDWTDRFNHSYDGYNLLLVSNPLSVIVPTECFADEPAKWEKIWVNHFFHDKPEDQCNFRRRRLLAYTIQPLIFIGDWLLRFLIFAMTLIFGNKNASIKPLFHMLSMTLEDQAKTFGGGTYFIQQVEEDGLYGWQAESVWELLSYIVRKFWALPLMPIISVPLALAVFYHWTFHVLPLLIAASIVAGVITLASIIVFFANDGVLWVWERIVSLLSPAPPRDLWYLDQEEMDLLTCSTQDGPMTFKKLPSRKKSLRLRFKDLKSKVCKPFSA